MSGSFRIQPLQETPFLIVSAADGIVRLSVLDEGNKVVREFNPTTAREVAYALLRFAGDAESYRRTHDTQPGGEL